MGTPSERHLREALSAAVDGEAEALELRRVLGALGEDAELRARWRTAHVIGNAIRGEALAPQVQPPAVNEAPADGEVTEAHAAEAARAGGRSRRWLGAVAGGAVAASAAVMVVLVFGGAFEPAPVPSLLAPPMLADGQALAGQPGGAPSELDLRRANTYVLHHAQHVAVAARPAAMPFVKALAHDGRIRTVALRDTPDLARP